MSRALERKTSLAFTIKAADAGEAIVRFSTPDGATPDRDREITGPDAFTEGVQVVVSPFGHRSISDGAIPAGRATIHRNGTADLTFFLDTPTGQETFATLKALGKIAQYSYGFHIRELGDLTPAMRAAGAVRYLKRLDVVELSPVVEGAGLGTGTLAIKSCGCGSGSTCGCSPARPSRAEREALVAESRRLLAWGAKLLAPSPEQLTARIRAGVEAVQQKYGYWPPAEARVDPELHREAVEYTAWAASRLGIHPPRVKWFGTDAAEAAHSRGMFYGADHDAIWVRADRRGWTLLKTCCHETLHAARQAHGLPQDERAVLLETEHLLHVYAKEAVYGLR